MMTYEGNGSVNSGVRGLNLNTANQNATHLPFGTQTQPIFAQGTGQIPALNTIANWNTNPGFAPAHTPQTGWYPNATAQVFIDPISGIATLVPVQGQTLGFGQGYGFSATQGWTPVNVSVFPTNVIPQIAPTHFAPMNVQHPSAWNRTLAGGVNPAFGHTPHAYAHNIAQSQTLNGLPVDGFERSAIFCPATCVSENNLCFSVTCELPGVAEKDIDVIWQHGTLVVRGQKRNRNIDDDCQVCVTDQTSGQFFRAINLTHVADCIDSTKITTKCTNGVLEVTLPKVRQSTGSYFKVGSTK